MGRCFANGIPTKITVYSNSGKKEKGDIKIIKNHLSKYFNIDSYDINSTYEDGFEFILKKDCFLENIYDCCRELAQLTYFVADDIFCASENLDDKYKEMELDKIIQCYPEIFNKENFPLNIEYVDGKVFYKNDNSEYHREYHYAFILEQYWLYWNCEILGFREKYRIDVDAITLGSDYNKFNGDDETYLLYVVNSLKNKNYKNTLSKNNIFYIEG